MTKNRDPDPKPHPLGRVWDGCERRKHHSHGQRDQELGRIFKTLADLQRKSDLVIVALSKQMEFLMTVKSDFDAQTARINTALDGVRQDIADLKATIPTSGGMTAEETASVLADVTAVADKLSALDAENPAKPAA